jgi:Flp pilus assembly protein TadD
MKYTRLWILVSVLAASAQAQGSREATAASYVDRGNSWFTKGELERAIADFNLALEFNPRDAGAFCNRALARCKRGDCIGGL